MTKVKELLNCQLDTFEEKMPYMLAFYIKKVIQEDINKDKDLFAAIQ